MRAWIVEHPAPIDEGPMRFVERDAPEPGPGQIRARVRACGVCRTDLHLAEGDLAPRRLGVVPGHEVVGVVDALGDGAYRFRLGERVGIAWLRRTCQTCRFCRAGHENLCLSARFTGWDDDGGFAEQAVVDQDYAYPIPAGLSDAEAAPLLCAGIIGYRALRRSQLPPSGRLGIYGFGASAHLAAQIAIHEGATVHVMTRSKQARNSPSPSAPRPRAASPTRRPNRSTRRSCSPRSARSCPSPSKPSTAAARSRWPASTSPPSPRCPMRSTCSRSATCAA